METSRWFPRRTCQRTGTGVTSTKRTIWQTCVTNTFLSTVVHAGLMPRHPHSPIELRSLAKLLGQILISHLKSSFRVNRKTKVVLEVLPWKPTSTCTRTTLLTKHAAFTELVAGLMELDVHPWTYAVTANQTRLASSQASMLLTRLMSSASDTVKRQLWTNSFNVDL